MAEEHDSKVQKIDFNEDEQQQAQTQGRPPSAEEEKAYQQRSEEAMKILQESQAKLAQEFKDKSEGQE